MASIDNSADFFSRKFSDSTEWMLKNDIFLRVCRQFFIPEVDLFVSRLNKRTSSYVSWFPDPEAFHFDAFTLDWSGLLPYIFPPFNLTGRVLNKVIQDKVEKAILIFSLWRAQTWFPVLLENTCSLSVRLPCHKHLLTLAHNRNQHPLARNLQIIVTTVSGQPLFIKAFLRKLLILSSLHGKKERGNNTLMLGEDGCFGTVSGLPIPFLRLKL